MGEAIVGGLGRETPNKEGVFAWLKNALSNTIEPRIRDAHYRRATKQLGMAEDELRVTFANWLRAQKPVKKTE